MPNWCSNRLTVRGDVKELEKFKKKAKYHTQIVDNVTNKPNEYSSAFSLQKLYSMPKELENTISPSKKKNKDLVEKYGFDNWYDWRVAHWGTKWDVEATIEENGEEEAVYRFDSAWSPPIEAVHLIGITFKKLTFELVYEEGGNGFCGSVLIMDGQLQENVCVNISYSKCRNCGEDSYKSIFDNCCVQCGEEWSDEMEIKKEKKR